MRIILHDAPPVDFVIRAGGDEIEADDALAAPLTTLAARLLQWHIQSREGVKIACGPRVRFRRRQSRLGVEVFCAHELLLSQLAAGLEVAIGHDRGF